MHLHRQVLEVKETNLFLRGAIFALAVTILFLSGCSDKKMAAQNLKGKITPAKLSAGEKQLLNAVGLEKYFVFEVSLPKVNDEWAYYWVDHYRGEGGVPKKLTEGGTSLKYFQNNRAKLVFAVLDEPGPDSFAQNWIISFFDAGSDGGSATTSRIKTKTPKEKNLASTSKSTNGVEIVKGKPVILAVIAEGKDSVRSVPDGVFTGDDEAMRSLYTNESVYIFRFELRDKDK